MFDINQEIEFHYPANTHVRYLGQQLALKKRQFIVRRIRDLVAEPLTPDEFIRRPYVRRSRYLVVGIEYEQRQWRQFYVGCSAEYSSPSQLRLALYEPSGKRPAKLLLRPFEATMHDRAALIRWLHRHKHKDFHGLQLRVFADDLRLVLN